MKFPRIPMIGILFILFILMGALLYFSDNDGRDTTVLTVNSTPATATPAPVIFSDLTGGEITAIQLIDPHSRMRLTLEYGNEGWYALEYPDRTVNQQEIAYILTTIANLPYQRTFSIDTNTSLEQYGFFANGQYLFGIQFITIDATGQVSTHVIAIGNPSSDHKTPTPNQSFYALVDDVPQMYLVSAPAIYYLIGKMTDPPLE
jgi:hypothetical protein